MFGDDENGGWRVDATVDADPDIQDFSTSGRSSIAEIETKALG
jgi:hypothetical protein